MSCERPFCAPSSSAGIRLVAAGSTRVVVHELPGEPISASALFERLNAGIGREHLLDIAGTDPFGAHQHFPLLVRIRESGRVPQQLDFDPGEALRLSRHASGPDVHHLTRAWCCTLLVITTSDHTDDLNDTAPQLVESCLALGGDVPQLAERLLAWRAVTEEPNAVGPPGQDHGCADPVALLALILLRAAGDSADPRLGDLVRTLADMLTVPPRLPSGHRPRPMKPVARRRWRHLVDTVLAPLATTGSDLDRLITALRRADRKHRVPDQEAPAPR
ncbi:hypothetical protein [Streptomyces sp. NRRL S-495]|uniref:hypothetical protein n=1 Tax=Streptomyces sp. NRRL S-495 TaxID=1609133 RepID=UPI0005F9798E|nr:hypothetical protein [Streptomyces sp. NRRL S-495]KJY30528.1 hypothetical protein VR45_27375 [Streptomyces sp. NRRL S-495]